MRRAAFQLLRRAHRPFVKSSVSERRRRLALIHSYRDAPLPALPSSMYFRNFSWAVVGSLVATGAYYYTGRHSYSATSGEKDFAAQYSTSAAHATTQAVEATRRALILDRGQLYTGTISGDGPLSKDTDDSGRKVLEMMTPEQATSRLRRNEESFLVGRGQGVVRYDVVQLSSNDPIEDDHAENIVEIADATEDAQSALQSDSKPTNDWMFWGVFDGHSGWTTSAKLRQSLISYVARELNQTYTQSTTVGALPNPDSIDQAIKKGFVGLDHSIVHASVDSVLKNASKPHAAEALAPALSGSCALLSFYDASTKTLRVACTGDSRAVLGRKSVSSPGLWTAQPLSVDQTGGNPSEAARLRAEHPGEPDVVRVGRVLGGLEPTRAFGDATYKWSRAIQEKMKKEFFGKTPNPQIRTPPYVTAEPMVTRTEIQPENGDFLVLATDGLWEMLSNEEVVGLVGQWLQKHPEATAGSSQGKSHTANVKDEQSASWLSSWFAGSNAPPSSHLPVDVSAGSLQDRGENGGQRAPIRQQQWGISNDGKQSTAAAPPLASRFVFEDKNAATHLIRNALGGKDQDMICALLTLPSPYSRRYRDDLTVEVVFFGEESAVSEHAAPDAAAKGDRSLRGKIVPNEEATAGGNSAHAEVKAKL